MVGTRRVTVRALVAVIALVGLGVSAGAAAGAPSGSGSTSDPDVVPGSFIVQLEPGQDARTEGPRLARQYGGRTGHIYTAAVSGFQFLGSDQSAANLARNPKVAAVEPDRVVRLVAASQVPTGVRRVDARDGGGTNISGANGSGVRVAVLDTGVDDIHEQLNGRVVAGVDCVGEGDSTNDGHGHGTHVAGTVAGKDVGVAPSATIVAVKVLNSSGSGSSATITCGVDYVTGQGNIAVANMSLGGSSSENASSCSSSTLHQAICNSVNKGTLYAVAAGNDGRDASGFFPAKYPEVFTVSAFSDLDGARDPAAGSECVGMGPWKDCDEIFAGFSNYGSIVDVMAPGVRIYSSIPGNKYDTYSGTSMAAPHVAGVAALVKAGNSGLTVSGLESRLKATGECPGATWASSGSCSGSWSGDGDTTAEPMVNAKRAVANTTGGTTITNTAPTASFTYSCTDLACSFDGSASSDLDGDALSYSWNFGDGSTATGATTSHTYASGNTYSVTLTVSDGSLSDSDTQSVTVSSSTSGGGSTGTISATETYNQFGGKTNNQHLDVTIRVTDGTTGVSGAVVSIDLYKNGSKVGSAQGTTDSSGNVTFGYRGIGPGCYSAKILSVTKTGYEWDKVDPTNSIGC